MVYSIPPILSTLISLPITDVAFVQGLYLISPMRVKKSAWQAEGPMQGSSGAAEVHMPGQDT